MALQNLTSADFLIRYHHLPREDEGVNKETREKFIPYTGFVVCVLTGLLLHWYPEVWWVPSTARALSDALMVAGLIGISIEKFAAKQLVRHAADELSERLVGYGLPEDAQKVINGIVRETRVYRNYHRSYSLKPKDGKMLITVTTAYTVVNNGKNTDSYRPRSDEEGMYDPHLISLEYGDLLITDESEVRVEDGTTRVVSFAPQKTIKIEPSKPQQSLESLEASQKCDVRWETTVLMPEEYSDVISFGGVTVRPIIELSDKPDDIDFQGVDDPGGVNSCLHLPGSSTWKYSRAFVKAQHVRVWWRRKPTTPVS